MEVLAQAGDRNVAEMIRQIRACQYGRETREATPVGWEPGKKVQKPGEELVGKVCQFSACSLWAERLILAGKSI
jgi:peroxiredoxin (alkyl hydroperoxide reductase subunit C)